MGRPGKKIMCINDGIIYNSIIQAADNYKISRSAICKQLAGVRGQAAGLYFIYVEDGLDAMELQKIRIAAIEKIYNLKNFNLQRDSP